MATTGTRAVDVGALQIVTGHCRRCLNRKGTKNALSAN